MIVRYRLFEELDGSAWADCAAECLEITGYHILEKKDGSLNQGAIDALKATLGWDGRDPFWLQDNVHLLVDHPVQVKLGFEEYNGSTSLKVQFLNPYGSRGGSIPKADDDLRRTVGNRLGAKFRAQAGGTPAPAPKPAGKPQPPRPAAKPAPAAKTPAAPPATMEQAWEEFSKHCPLPPEGKWDQAGIEKEWFRILAELFAGKQPGQLGPAEWGIMLAEGPAKIIPF